MATNSGKKRRCKKIYIGGIILYTRIDTVEQLEEQLQSSYNSWVGFDDNGEPKLKVKITELAKNKRYRFDFARHYGDFYSFRQSSDQNSWIFAWDEQLILGESRRVGTTADFDTLNGRYVISNYVGDVKDRLKGVCKEHGASRIRDFEYEQTDRDHISVTITL